MPLKISAAWEYWMPSEEMAEAFGEEKRSSDFLGLYDHRIDNQGLRYGRGNPNHSKLFLARSKAEVERPSRPERNCEWCGEVVSGRGKRFCSKHCARRKLDVCKCVGCGTEFQPAYRAQKFCSVACAAPFGAPKVSIDYDLLTSLWIAGERLTSIALLIGVSVGWVKKVRRKLKLPARSLRRKEAGETNESGADQALAADEVSGRELPVARPGGEGVQLACGRLPAGLPEVRHGAG